MTSSLVRRSSTTDDIVDAVRVLPIPLDPNEPDLPAPGEMPKRWTLRTATVAWLTRGQRRSLATQRAYFRDLAHYLYWCQTTGLDPRDANRADIDVWTGTVKGAAATVARAMSTVSSWYRYCASIEVARRNPVELADRPAVEYDKSSTIGLSVAQMAAFMAAARAGTHPSARRDAAILSTLSGLAVRVSEAINLDVPDLRRENRGYRTAMITGKGGKQRELPIPPPVAEDIDLYWVERAAAEECSFDDLAGPAFVTRSGRRVDRGDVFHLVRRTAARAGIASAAQLSPHSLRHSAATAALDLGAPLRDLQDMLGHADPRTTRRYDRDRNSLVRSPTHLLGPVLARRPQLENHDDKPAHAADSSAGMGREGSP